MAAVHQVEGYPCVLIYREQERNAWIEKIREYLPKDVQILDAGEVNSRTPKESIWLLEYYDLEHKISLPADVPRHRSVIVDHGHYLKNPRANRTRAVANIAGKVGYRFLVTDFPVNLSPKDLREPLQILGKQNEFENLGSFLDQVGADPLDNRMALRSNTAYQRKLAALYRQLRATCLVRRAYDPGLRSQETILPNPRLARHRCEISAPGDGFLRARNNPHLCPASTNWP